MPIHTGRDIHALDVAQGDASVDRTSIYVYEAPLRAWHWINALALTILAVTGYFIGQPLPSVPGEASDASLMVAIREIHFITAYVLAIGWLVRIYWAFVGNPHSRQLFKLPFWRKSYWNGVVWEASWYAFLRKEPKKYVGHNPLAQFVMFTVFTVGMFFMIITGFALYSEGAGIDSWQYALFGWVFDIFPNSQAVHTWHRLGMWIFVTYVIVHVYAAVREDILSRQSMISTMISGERMFKDNRDD
ncbi:Ni/Fe-hydrogenase, b-type cytochrome subunit [Roseospirillum parvum]|uniref:Probable Ni/Fe-hydrogenase B-type cytochrome subunit n=1 Tax=Roseospirillum parvum TaxID=83401 RepID=A0A1G8B0V8_9PROT|nr:Ni/Fe-hydrogenase, b-type cytochrome subunit [Roseospirillum parvum]SDH26899.1 Ni/Fe-hydrogenase 1 B-type cytochrome subunit [Roseospirillum parvum]